VQLAGPRDQLLQPCEPGLFVAQPEPATRISSGQPGRRTRLHPQRPDELLRLHGCDIRAFERLLDDEGTRVVKVFLHVSKDEQRQRLQERLENPEKAWKFRLGDLDDRMRWDDFMAAYEEVITATSTEWAPWYIVPADHNWVRNVAVAELLVHTLEELDPQYPSPDPGLANVQVS
jgi:polyphosphate kinase 2 (PPK2 family)